MPIFEPPTGLVQVAHFSLPRVQTWGSQRDGEYKELVRQSRGRYKHQVPDVENIPKLIVDALTGYLYPDDNLHHVRGVQIEAEWGRDEDEMAEVWIYAKAKEGSDA